MIIWKIFSEILLIHYNKLPYTVAFNGDNYGSTLFYLIGKWALDLHMIDLFSLSFSFLSNVS